MNPIDPISLFDAVKKEAGNETEVIFEQGIFTGVPFPSRIFDSFDFYIYQNGEKVKGVQADFYSGKKFEGDVILSKYFVSFFCH